MQGFTVKNHLILRVEPEDKYVSKVKPRIKDLVAIISVLINRKHNSCGLRESTTSASLWEKKYPPVTIKTRVKFGLYHYNLFLGWQAQEWAQSPWYHWTCNWKCTKLHLLLDSYAVQGSHMEREVTICIFREPQEIYPRNQDGICRLEE